MTELPFLDPRFNAFRPDLADVSLRAMVKAKKFVEPTLYQCVRGLVPLMVAPGKDAERVSEIRYGEFLDVFEIRKDGTAWVQGRNDRYVGYIDSRGSLNQTIAAMMNRINVLQTFIYEQPDLKSPVLDRLTLGAFVSLAGEAGDFYPLASGGFIFKKHVAPTDEAQCQDYVFTAGQLLGTPYLWGGRTPLGIDCSGLVQLALDMAGIDVPRDADQQRDALGHPLPCHPNDVVWKRGDIVFFEKREGEAVIRHVGIMTGYDHLVHADDHNMQVTVEPLKDVVARGYAIVAAGRP